MTAGAGPVLDATGDGGPPPDVVVVGAGLAGLTAAVRAQELGRRVMVLERSPREPGWGNSLVSGGALHAVLRDPRTAPDELVAEIRRLTDGHADESVAHAFAHHAAPALAWVTGHGGVLTADGSAPHRSRVFAPVRTAEPGLRHAGFGVEAFLTGLRGRLIAHGGRVRQPARATTLRPDGGRWVVGTEDGHEVSAAAVVLADGGFQADPGLVRRYVGCDSYLLRGVDTSTGDCLRMGLAVGGVAVNMSGFYGHLLVREARRDPGLRPYPILDPLAEVGIVVGPDGRRLVDESHHGVTTTNAVAHCPTPDRCWLVVDDEAWRTVGRAGVTPPNPYLLDRGATVLSAPTVAALATAMGVDPAGLRATVDALPGGPPPRTGRLLLATPPLHAIPLLPGITFTFGGLKVDARARLLDASGNVITGLYAAGGTMGGLHGGPRAGYAGGLLEALVFGLIAGTDAAQTAASSA